MSKELLVPVPLKRQGVMHDTMYARGAADREDAARIDAEQMAKNGHTRWGADYVMEAVPSFVATLRVVRAGHKNGYVELVSTDGATYPMFLSDYVGLMAHAMVTDGWIAARRYETCKKSNAYGIRPVG
jgi:hypothetical protein